jgi:uncharacterized membrane protein YhiD involved in acid resistance
MAGRARSLCVRAAALAAVLLVAMLPIVLVATVTVHAQQPAAQPFPPAAAAAPRGAAVPETLSDLHDALIRLPLAAVLGTALALRPRRRGTPNRTPAVVQTQIILAVVGALVMLVVGASLARAFGIVGAANLIRYRAKIEDPKDAGVMLCALAVGLASGVGLYALTIFSTAFLVAALSIIESFAPKTYKHFEVSVKAPADVDGLRPAIERVFDRYKLGYELRTTSTEEVCYDARVPFEQDTDRITNSLLKIRAKGEVAVEWSEKKDKLT